MQTCFHLILYRVESYKVQIFGLSIVDQCHVVIILITHMILFYVIWFSYDYVVLITARYHGAIQHIYHNTYGQNRHHFTIHMYVHYVVPCVLSYSCTSTLWFYEYVWSLCRIHHKDIYVVEIFMFWNIVTFMGVMLYLSL